MTSREIINPSRRYLKIYKIRITKTAEKDLDNLSSEIRDRIGKKIKEFSINPFQFSIKLKIKGEKLYRFRVGSYRIIFEMDEDNIVILRIGDRKDIYR
ncbi:MAG TPA: type II toxin-antitoxin system RelE/ParE family toxin [Ignavibacteria bacterium]|nr:type II toxin-antitoxin system RelE/ParE family toxin [Ignavibacteria bacterium]